MSTPSSPRLYFAYGIHLHQPTMRSIFKGARMVGLARLKNHVISFHGHSAIWDGAIETVVPDKTSEVWGVLYQLTAYEWDQLDTFQDVRLDGTGEYFITLLKYLPKRTNAQRQPCTKKPNLENQKSPAPNTWILLFKAPSPTNFPNTILRNYVKLRRFRPHTQFPVFGKKEFHSRVIAPVAPKINNAYSFFYKSLRLAQIVVFYIHEKRS